jgi:hypothetical protein
LLAVPRWLTWAVGALAAANAAAATLLHLEALRVPPTVERADLGPVAVTTGVLVLLTLLPLRLGIRRRRRRGASKWPGGWRNPAVLAVFAYGITQVFWSTTARPGRRGDLRVSSAFVLVFACAAALQLLPRLAPSREG